MNEIYVGFFMKVFSNEDLVGRSDQDFTFERLDKKLSAVDTAFFLKKNAYDAILIFNPNIKEMLFVFLYKLLLGRGKTFFFDILLKKPHSNADKIRALIKRFLLKFVDVFLCVHKDLTLYTKYFGIPKRKCRYVAFKANNYDLRDQYKLTDGGYILSCGVSHRDYDTLFDAARNIDRPIKVLLPDAKNIQLHCAKVSLGAAPKNVEVIRHDFNRETWCEYLSAAHCVIIPIESECIQPAGISVYLESMMFKKPVIITDGPSTKGLIDDGKAVIVPPNNSSAISDAVKKLDIDSDYAKRIRDDGHAYALGLQGVDRLIADMKLALK